MFSKGLVFGAFDGLHEGHLALLQQARAHASSLVAALATDETIRNFKKVTPRESFDLRKQKLESSGLISHVCESVANNDYQCIRLEKPDCILLGYDQHALRDHLLTWLKQHKMDLPVIMLEAHEPTTYKSSLLYDRS